MEPHVWQVQELVQASPASVWATLTDLTHPWSRSSSLEQLTTGPFGVGTKWRESRPLLFLRDRLTIEVTECQEQALLQYTMDDGFNLLLYTFTLHAVSERSTLVTCTVDCRMNRGTDSSPSERLARFMEKQDGTLVKRLKGFVEADPALLSVY
ncbi:hypothetical protein WJX72_004599 [[Myrmecia] bisecta]|uniref:Uncharacterized protein n=1 Tax=[Myrmecia] bisecta TaxID=41462 RepID=A0AAW1PD05_9CHLO